MEAALEGVKIPRRSKPTAGTKNKGAKAFSSAIHQIASRPWRYKPNQRTMKRAYNPETAANMRVTRTERVAGLGQEDT
jgi:hypothetical protein